MVIYAGFLLMETPGKGTVSSLWLLFLEMRAQDSAQRLQFSALHMEIFTFVFWEKQTTRAVREAGFVSLWGNRGGHHEGGILLRHHKPKDVTQNRWGNGIKALEGQAAVTTRSKSSGTIIRDFIPNALHSLLSTLWILEPVMLVLESMGLVQWKSLGSRYLSQPLRNREPNRLTFSTADLTCTPASHWRLIRSGTGTSVALIICLFYICLLRNLSIKQLPFLCIQLYRWRCPCSQH